MRKDFVANVSHELRTPLTSFAATSRRCWTTSTRSPALEPCLQQMQQQGHDATLLNDLLLLAKLEANDYPSDNHPVTVQSLLRPSRRRQALSGQRGQQITLEPTRRCCSGQRGRLRVRFPTWCSTP